MLIWLNLYGICYVIVLSYVNRICYVIVLACVKFLVKWSVHFGKVIFRLETWSPCEQNMQQNCWRGIATKLIEICTTKLWVRHYWTIHEHCKIVRVIIAIIVYVHVNTLDILPYDTLFNNMIMFSFFIIS